MNFHNPLIALLFSLSFITLVSANDGAYYASGNQIIPLQETDISVKKEVLTIKRINDEEVRITVDYIFHNPTKEKTLLMGFEAGSPSGDVNGTPRKGEHPYIENFSVNISEKSIPYKVSILLPNDSKDDDEKLYSLEDLKNQQPLPNIEEVNMVPFFYVYHFPATFAPGDTRVVHTYDYAISDAVFIATSIDYLLTPALRWANKQIDDFTLIIDLGELQQYHVLPSFFENLDSWTTQGRVKIGMEDVKHEMTTETSRMMTVWQHQGSVTFHAINFKPKGELELFANRLLTRDDVLDAKTFRLSLQEYPHFNDDLKLKDEFTRKVLENLPYARRGYVFKNKELKEFYEKQPWYMPDSEYKDPSLTEEEKTWLNDLKKIQIKPLK